MTACPSRPLPQCTTPGQRSSADCPHSRGWHRKHKLKQKLGRHQSEHRMAPWTPPRVSRRRCAPTLALRTQVENTETRTCWGLQGSACCCRRSLRREIQEGRAVWSGRDFTYLTAPPGALPAHSLAVLGDVKIRGYTNSWESGLGFLSQLQTHVSVSK